MITMYTAHTTEIDEIDDAIDEIFGQLDLAALKKNTVGLIHCFPEFIETGVASALCERLPFEVIGMTSLSQGVSGCNGKYVLCLTVLTSDDAAFSCAFAQALSEGEPGVALAEAYRRAAAKLPGAPTFIISYFPFIAGLGVDALLDVFDEICGGIPIFGSVCMGIDLSYARSNNICGDAFANDALAMLLVHSADMPTFSAIALPERDIRSTKAVVTDSAGTLVRSVNGISLKEYLSSIGYDSVERSSVMQVYYPGSSSPVVMTIFEINADGSALCGGKVPVGSSITFGEATKEGILETARQCVTALQDRTAIKGALFHPCAGRYFKLFPEYGAEIEVIEDAIGDKTSYALAYSGGEICPVAAEDGTLQNRFHNYSLCACVF